MKIEKEKGEKGDEEGRKGGRRKGGGRKERDTPLYPTHQPMDR